MEIHHSKHHNTYVTNLNAATEKLADATAKGDVTSIIQCQQVGTARPTVKCKSCSL